jgi:polyisoprenoid-binding protein YceI
MKPIIFIAVSLLLLVQTTFAQDVYATNKGYASFFSKAPVSDVDARTGKVKARLNTSTQELTFDIKMTDFEFRSSKMGRDARKKYIEIDQFPDASFRGKITTDIDYKKPGTYPATATGKLKIHGTEKEVTEKGTVRVQKGKIRLASEFSVQLKDYNIETPKILGQEMTEDKMLVKIEATLTPGPLP